MTVIAQRFCTADLSTEFDLSSLYTREGIARNRAVAGSGKDQSRTRKVGAHQHRKRARNHRGLAAITISPARQPRNIEVETAEGPDCE